MGNFIIKADRDRDLYMEWNTIADGPTAIGTRDQIRDYLTGMVGRGPSDPVEERLQRADETGTSAEPHPEDRFTGPMPGAWEDTGFVVEQRGWLPRTKLAAFLDAYLVAEEQAYTLLEAIDEGSES